jgi:hypothetical protein
MSIGNSDRKSNIIRAQAPRAALCQLSLSLSLSLSQYRADLLKYGSINSRLLDLFLLIEGFSRLANADH